jgi:hypothetical protein
MGFLLINFAVYGKITLISLEIIPAVTKHGFQLFFVNLGCFAYYLHLLIRLEGKTSNFPRTTNLLG